MTPCPRQDNEQTETIYVGAFGPMAVTSGEPTRILQCLRCGRALKALESQQRGYGPVCWERARLARAWNAQTTVPQQRRLEEST